MNNEKRSDVDRHRESILGLERRLEREETLGRDITVARLVLMQHYAAYAAAMVQHTGGSVVELKTLTDRHNLMPLAWADGRCVSVD